MNKSTLIHIGAEVVVIGGIAIYFQKKNNTLQQQVLLLQQQLDQLSKDHNELGKAVNQLYSLYNNLNNKLSSQQQQTNDDVDYSKNIKPQNELRKRRFKSDLNKEEVKPNNKKLDEQQAMFIPFDILNMFNVSNKKPSEKTHVEIIDEDDHSIETNIIDNNTNTNDIDIDINDTSEIEKELEMIKEMEKQSNEVQHDDSL